MAIELESKIRELLRSTDAVAQEEGGWKSSVTALRKIAAFVEAEAARREHHVFLTVAGGVAYTARTPSNVKVHIIDYDDLQAGFNQTFDELSEDAQRFYFESNSI